MISAIILADDDIEALGATLAALVSAVARGLLREAVVVDRSLGHDVAVIADAAGTAHVKPADGDDPWRAGVASAKAPWVLLLESGDVPDPTWMVDAERFLLATGLSEPRAMRAAVLARHGFGVAALAYRLGRGLQWRFRPGPGVLCPRSAFEGTGSPRLRLQRLRTGLHRVAPRRRT